MVSALEAVRQGLRAEDLDFVWVPSTDRYLNEYVPPEESIRQWLTGFDGSMGEALVGHEGAWLVVDGRYWQQAEAQVDPRTWTVVRTDGSTMLDEATQEILRARGPNIRVGFDPDRFTMDRLRRLRSETRCVWVPTELLGRLRPRTELGASVCRWVAPANGNRRKAIWEHLPKDLDALVIQPLDDIAYLSGLRAHELPHQSTFRAHCLLTRERLLLATEAAEPVRNVEDAEWCGTQATDLATRALALNLRRVGFDPRVTAVGWADALRQRGLDLVEIKSPIAKIKSNKNPQELLWMKAALRRADLVMEDVIETACADVVAGKTVTEADVRNRVEERFRDHGATDLSFSVIAAAGVNAAHVHYTSPSRSRSLRRGELMLIDAGAYFHEGYATDLTRTFLVGAPEDRGRPEQIERYTLVLRAALAGMRARLPSTATGAQLDGVVRARMWEVGCDYAHGTGHGVGISVHEYPPRISGLSADRLEPNQVFSVEPGLYDPAWGGIRIENLCTVKPDPRRPGWLRVVPLTYSPLDERLIDPNALDEAERSWLAAFGEAHRLGQEISLDA
ncbi:MAG: M24 family metallopeptidase [Myxococcota bacterium]